MASVELMNRDLNWITFNSRVLDEACKKERTILERLNFFGIASSNMSEFMMVRYPSYMNEFMKKREQRRMISSVSDFKRKLDEKFMRFNKTHKVLLTIKEVPKKKQEELREYFIQNVYPVIQPIQIGKNFSFRIKQSPSLYIFVKGESEGKMVSFIIEVPKCLDRIIYVDNESFIMLEHLILNNVRKIIDNVDIKRIAYFTVTRSIEPRSMGMQDSSSSTYEYIKRCISERRTSPITSVDIKVIKNDKVVDDIRRLIELNGEENTIYTSIGGLISMDVLKTLRRSFHGGSGKDRVIINKFPDTDVFAYIKQQDRLVMHPYESYDGSVVKFIEESSKDEKVKSIKILLYRTSTNSKIINALVEAAHAGKHVVVVVELKARFDESHNIEISKILEEAGCTVVYTDLSIKTHAKVCIVTRVEKGQIRTYSHIGTGNYNEQTAKLYVDYSYFSRNPEIGYDLTRFFNLVIGKQKLFKSDNILYAPFNMKDGIIEIIKESIRRKEKNKKDNVFIILKCNSLTDVDIAERIISAEKAGVKITIIVRGASILYSYGNLKIISIIGDYLEHSRVYCYGVNGRVKKMYIGSSDLMYRNLNKRNELLIRVKDSDIIKTLYKHLKLYMRDNVNSRIIKKGYNYEEVRQKKGEKKVSCFDEFFKMVRK